MPAAVTATPPAAAAAIGLSTTASAGAASPVGSSTTAASASPPALPVATASTSNGSSASTNGGGGGDDLGPSDEVKVFNNEGEDEREEATERIQAELLEEKSSLITESEKKATDHLGLASALYGVGMSPYLAFPGSYVGRSPWDSLASPPPAHMSAYLDKTAGFRPPIYPPGLAPHAAYAAAAAAAASSPYGLAMGAAAAAAADPMAAAWHHHQAAATMYHANAAAALRPPSPYGLPIASPNMFRSPFHHNLAHLVSAAASAGSPTDPGRSPSDRGASRGSNPSSLPHHGGLKQEKSDKSQQHSPSKQHHVSSAAAAHHNKEPHIKKPLNAFMLYMKEMRPVVQAECTLKESAAINQILGRRWHGLSREEQAKYYEKARAERQRHMQMYPHWNARDNYRFGLKKKKRKREKGDDPAGGMKKCRARYGLDQQDLWCKPCRRKKKCVRVQAYLEKTAAAAAAANGGPGAPGQQNHLGQPNSHGGNPGAFGNNNKYVSSINGSAHSDSGSDAETDDDDMEDGSNKGSNKGSLESTSEQSLTSPAGGFGSLPSLGSPSGSVASPSTPSAAPPPLALPQPPSHFGQPEVDWTRGLVMGGAFKPPAGLPPYHYQPAMHQAAVAAAAAGGFHPPSAAAGSAAAAAAAAAASRGKLGAAGLNVGNDPRDSKHPLSVMQLTAAHAFTAAAGVSGGAATAPAVQPVAARH